MKFVRTSVPCTAPKRGFTLIELLTVVAIVAILGTILIVAISSSRNRAILVKDLSNLKQIHSIFMLYAADNGGRLPPADGRIVSSTYRWRWYGTEHNAGQRDTHRSPLMDYANIESVLEFNKITIPTLQLSGQIVDSTATVNVTEGAYGYPFIVNYQLISNTIGTQSVKVDEVITPSSTLLVTGSNPQTWGPGFQNYGGLNRIGGIDNQTVPVVWADGHTSVLSLDDIMLNAERWVRLQQ